MYADEDADQAWVTDVIESVDCNTRLMIVPIHSAHAVILCLSEHFRASSRCRLELRRLTRTARLRRGGRGIYYVLDPKRKFTRLLRDAGLQSDAQPWFPNGASSLTGEGDPSAMQSTPRAPFHSDGSTSREGSPLPPRPPDPGDEVDELNLPDVNFDGHSSDIDAMHVPDIDAIDVGYVTPFVDEDEVQPPPPPIEDLDDRFEVAVYAQPVVAPDKPFVLEMFAFLSEHRDDAVQRARRGGLNEELGSEGLIRASLDSLLTARLEFLNPGWVVDPPQKEFVWTGYVTNVQFVVTPPGSASPGVYVGRITMFADGLETGSVSFQIRVGKSVVPETAAEELGSTVRVINSAFASYSSKDRPQVFTRVQGIQAAGVEVFLDLVTLRSGDDWESQLKDKIRSSDVLFLFWSKWARESVEVEREWRLALDEKGLSFIKPVPLQSPDVAPPPVELQSLHFNNLYLHLEELAALRNASQGSAGKVD